RNPVVSENADSAMPLLYSVCGAGLRPASCSAGRPAGQYSIALHFSRRAEASLTNILSCRSLTLADCMFGVFGIRPAWPPALQALLEHRRTGRPQHIRTPRGEAFPGIVVHCGEDRGADSLSTKRWHPRDSPAIVPGNSTRSRDPRGLDR